VGSAHRDTTLRIYGLKAGFPLDFCRELPMNPAGELPKMQITLTVSDEIVREAGERGLPVIDFVESLLDKGRAASKDAPPVMLSAIERIRALRSTAVETKG
jgi:hypothetical protein